MRAAECPERTALLDQGGATSWRELDAACDRAASGLAAAGVGRADTVCLGLPAGRDFAVAMHATIRLGAAVFPLNLRLGAAERTAALERAAPRLVVERALEQGPSSEQQQPPPPPPQPRDSTATLCRIETSGTTGQPRLVDLSDANIIGAAAGSAARLGVEPDDVWLCCLPLHHIGGLSILLRSAIDGTAALIQDGFGTAAVDRALAESAVSLISLVPTQLLRLLDAGVDLGRARAILIGGAPLSAATAARARRAGAPIIPTYGLTEAASQVATGSLREDCSTDLAAGCVGYPLAGSRVAIAADGEVLIAGPTVAAASIGDDGWLRSGDLGRLDSAGRLYITGRRDDLIISGGENVVPDKVEAVLEIHPAVAEAAVIGREDEQWGEAVTAVVVLRPEVLAPTAAALRAHCAAALAAYEVPKRVEFAAALPRTASGKLRRRDLRLAAQSVRASAYPSRS